MLIVFVVKKLLHVVAFIITCFIEMAVLCFTNIVRLLSFFLCNRHTLCFFIFTDSHHVQLNSNNFQSSEERLAQYESCKRYPQKITFKFKLTKIRTRFFSRFNGTYIHALIQNICRTITCLKSFNLFYHILQKAGNLKKIKKNGKSAACL